LQSKTPINETLTPRDSLKPLKRPNPKVYWSLAMPFAVKNIQILVELVLIIPK